MSYPFIIKSPFITYYKPFITYFSKVVKTSNTTVHGLTLLVFFAELAVEQVTAIYPSCKPSACRSVDAKISPFRSPRRLTGLREFYVSANGESSIERQYRRCVANHWCNQISSTEWSDCLRSTTPARVRVGRIFSLRFTRLISRHIPRATLRASCTGRFR